VITHEIMHCIVKDCPETTRQARQVKCWREKNMCQKHCAELHPEVYRYKYNPKKVTTRRL